MVWNVNMTMHLVRARGSETKAEVQAGSGDGTGATVVAGVLID